MLKKISQILPISVGKHNLIRQFEASQVCAAAKKVDKNIEPLSYKNHTLKVKVSSSAEGNEVVNRENELIEKINGELGKEIVKRIKTVVIKMQKSKCKMIN